MGTYYRILPKRNLAYCHYDGVITMAKAEAVFGAYVADPEHRPGQLQLVDFSDATGWDADFITLMQTQAKMAATFLSAGGDVPVVFFAPTPPLREMAERVARSWRGVPGLVPIVQESESGALSVLGQAEDSLAALFAAAARPPDPPAQPMGAAAP